MKTEITDISPVKKSIKIEIDAESLKQAADVLVKDYSKQANIPGFRKGHAPLAVVGNRYKKEIRSEVIRDMLPHVVSHAIADAELKVIGEPQVNITNLDALENFGKIALNVEAIVDVLPDIELGDVKGIELTRRTRPITEKDIDDAIEMLREQSASLEPVEDRPSETGDTVTVDFDGRYVDEPDAEHIVVADVEVELGGKNVQVEFNENLSGVHADDEKVFEVDYPEDFSSKGLAGKKVEYTAKVTAVRRKEVPKADDEFAKSLDGDLESLEALREKVKLDLAASAEKESQRRLDVEAVDKLADMHQFELPKVLIDHQSRNRMQSVIQDLMQRGFDPRQHEFNFEKLKEQVDLQSVRELKVSLLLETIADNENLDVTDEEVAAEIQSVAIRSRQSVEQVRAALTKEGGERSIADSLRNRKALAFLIENARISDGEWLEETDETATAIQDEVGPDDGEESADAVTAESATVENAESRD